MINIYHIFYFVKINLFDKINYFNLSKEKNTLIQIKKLFINE